MAPPVKIKTFESYSDREYLDEQVNRWLDRNKDKIEVINVSTSSRHGMGIIYMATIAYKGDVN